MVSVGFADAGLEQRVNDGVAQAEALLQLSVEHRDPFVREAASHLLNAGGKRFRPLLVMLAAEFGDPAAVGVVPSAVVVELTHLASLYHDDVMDEAPLRRGAPSANARWDNLLAILIGDYLFAQASKLCSTLGAEAVGIQSETFARLVEGQVAETIGPHEGEDPLTHYLQVVADKTGSLIATSARFGALTSGASPEVIDALTEFGERIGVAFQLSDDVLDIASDSLDSGKTPGTDLREGVPTLPTLFAQRSTRPEDARLLELLAGPIHDEADVAWVISALREHPSLDEARAYVQSEADAARALLDKLPSSPARDALATLCDTLASRLT